MAIPLYGAFNHRYGSIRDRKGWRIDTTTVQLLTERSTFLPQFRPLGESRTVVFLEGAASVVSCSPTERSTEEETSISRAVSGSCVCVRNLQYVHCRFVYLPSFGARPRIRRISRGDRGIRLNLQGNRQEY